MPPRSSARDPEPQPGPCAPAPARNRHCRCWDRRSSPCRASADSAANRPGARQAAGGRKTPRLKQRRGRNARKADALPALSPHQHGLGLVVGGMTGQHQAAALAARQIRQQAVAGKPGGCRRCQSPAYPRSRRAAGARFPSLAHSRATASASAARPGAQLMVDGCREQPDGWAGLADCIARQQQQSGRIAAA